MDEEDDTGGYSQSYPNSNTIVLRTEEDIAKELKEWMEIGIERGGVGTKKLYDNAIQHIESKLDRPLSYLELTWTERKYVITLLELWLKKSLGKAFEYLNDEENDISQYMSIVISQLNSINSFEDIRYKLNDVESPLFNWCDGNCRYLQLILEQEDLFKNTPRFTAFVICYLKQFKTSCIEHGFSRCLSEIANNVTHEMFIANLNVFLSNVHEEKNVKDILDKLEFLIHYVKGENKTGQEIIKQRVAMFRNSTETEEGAAGREWLQTFLSTAETLSKEEWPLKLQLLTKEICKRFLLPETEIQSIEEDGKQILFITGVVIYVSKTITKMVTEMSEFKVRHTDNKNENMVQKVKIVGLQSVHVDCDLDNDTWHGINIEIVTDKLIIDDEVCFWDVSGKTAIINSPMRDNVRKFHQPGESGGNVHVVCNQIINGQKWTIVSDGGDGSDGYKWTEEEFKEFFPSISTDDREENMKTVLTTLEQILPREHRTRGKDILPGHKGNFLIDGIADDGGEITAIFYEENNIKGSLILIKRGHIGQGGYGGDITVECLSAKGSSSRTEIPFEGTDTRREPLKNVRMGVYEASGSNGKTGKMTGDVAFIHQVGQIRGNFYGFQEEKKILIRLEVQKPKKQDTNLYIEYESKKYAKLILTNYSNKCESDSVANLVGAVKKNAAIRQNLLKHFDEIDERKQMTKSISKMLSHPTEDHSSSIDEIINEMDNKVHKFHQLATQRQQNQSEQIQQEQYVRPAIDSLSPLPKPKIIGRLPVWNDKKDDGQSKENSQKNFSVYCLDELLTEDGIDSALHCLFGQINSEGKYVCKDTNNFRKRITKHIRKKRDGEKTYNAVGTFVLRVKNDKRFPAATATRNGYIKSITNKYQQLKGMETQVLRWLNHNDDYDDGEFLDPEQVDEWNKAWKSIGNKKTVKTELFKEQEDWRNVRDLKQECAKYIESSTGTLGLAELEILAIILQIKINIYVINHVSSSFEYRETLRSRDYKSTSKVLIIPNPSRRYCILYEGSGRWKRLVPKYNLNFFCKGEEDKQNYNETSFSQLLSWMKEKINVDRRDEVKTSMENLKNKTPHKLFKLLLDHTNPETNPDMNDGQISQFINAICSLVRWVDYYNSRYVSPIFYLNIVEKCEPHQWECEFLLLEMEERMEKQWESNNERDKWRETVYNYFKDRPNDVVSSRFVKIVMEQIKENDKLFSLDLQKLFRILTVLEKGYGEELILNKDDIGRKCAMDLFYKDRGAFWEKIVDDWSNRGKRERMIDKERNKEYVNLLLEMEYKNEFDTPQNLTSESEGSERRRELCEKIVDLWLKEDEKWKKENEKEYVILVKLLLEMEYRNEIKLPQNLTPNKAKEIKSELFTLQAQNSISTESSRTVDQVLDEMRRKIPEIEHTEMMVKIIQIVKDSKSKKLVAEKDVKSIVKTLKSGGVDLNDNSSVAHFLGLFDYAVKEKMGFSLRDTQRVAITILLVNGLIGNTVNTLEQVSTGEGKSVIVAGVAIGFVLTLKQEKKEKNRYWKLQKILLREKEKNYNKVDVITSNDVLALRDSSLSVAEGGLKELYEFFNVTVANNCSQSVDERERAYNMDVVYGQLANFQRDYLLDKFYNRHIRGDRRMDYVIIDEADCMLLDRGSNVLYLSHDIPGMETLESLYVFIWEKIPDTSPDIIKSAVLFDLYGQITKENLNSIHAPLGQKEFESERSEIWEHLIEKKVINQQGRLLIHDVNEITKEMNDYEPINPKLKEKQLNSKIQFYFRTIIKRERRIRIPDHLLDFVDRKLDTWLDNARRALELEQDEDYVIDCDRSDTSPDLNPKVIIIDPETGTDQVNSQWDGALHQFLQLKEGCKLTMQSLRAVFISNANYIKEYGMISGVSATLGSKQEQDFLKKKYNCELFTVPTAFLNSFYLKPPKLLKTQKSWLKAILEETRKTITNRSIVIFCRSIKQVNKVHQHLKSAIAVLRDNQHNIHRYTRDYEKFQFEKEPGLDVGNVIVATNLAGRGTDIKLSPTLKTNGGLHICLTYFPENERVEEQAMGRAARKGEPGSGILILCELPTHEEPRADEEWGGEKIFVMKEERAWKERQRISQLRKDFNNIKMLDELIQHFTDNLAVLKIKDILRNEKFKKVKNSSENCIVQLPDEDVLLNLIHNNTLERWALWLDERDYSFKCFHIKHPENKFKISLHSFAGKEPNDVLKWMTPVRKIEITKHHAKAKSKQNIPSDTLNKFIYSLDNFFYPAAFYYHAFILLTKSDLRKEKFKKEKEEFIRTLRHAETILNEHIDMQISFIQIHQSERKLASSFYNVDGYKEQKQNHIEILEYFLGSIQWMLGSRCSISDLKDAVSEPPKVPGTIRKCIKKTKNLFSKKKKEDFRFPLEKTDDYFLQMIKKNCISCVINHPNTIPSNNIEIDKSTISSDEQDELYRQNTSKIILQIAKYYGVSLSLEEILKDIFLKALNEEKIEKKLKKKIKIPCTRKAFWNKLIDNKALHPLKDWEKMECFIMSDSEELLKELKLDKEKAMTLEFGSKSFVGNKLLINVLYNPTYDSQQHLRAAKKIMFSKKYVQEKLVPTKKYREIKKLFESNKIARLYFDKLQTVDLKSFGRLCKADLDDIHITNTSDQDEIWNYLIVQGIIDEFENFKSGYDLTNDFSYPECPAYAKAVTQLVRKKFVFELVRQQWLKATDNSNNLRTIHLLPRKPYRDMLADLKAAHVISGARVTEHFAIDFKGEVDKITESDQERKCLIKYLASRQSVLTAEQITTSPNYEFFLDFIERDMNFASELYVFRLVGFDCVIDIKDREWTAKRKLLTSLFAPLIITGGLASIGLGGYLTYYKFLSFGLSKNLFFMGGFSDILYVVETILSRKDFTWADYGRQRIRGAMGKMNPIDAIKAISKLSGSSNQSFRDATVTNEHRWNKRTDQIK